MPSDEHFTDYAYKKQLKHVVLNTEEFFVQGWGGGVGGREVLSLWKVLSQ